MDESPPPSLPSGVRRFASQRRVEVLVDPADDEDLSAQSLSPNTSLADERTDDPDRSSTPSQYLQVPESETPAPFVPRGVDENGVRGILRASGAPGSGNGVRFYPKNKFRVITPNPSALNTPQPAPAPAAQRNSFLSHLLSVSLPLRRATSSTPDTSATNVPPGRADESWEVPGQEGEVSLIGSSGPSERSWRDGAESPADDEGDNAEAEESVDGTEGRPEWRGQPEVHSSPLSLPTSGDHSRDISATDLPPPFPSHLNARPQPRPAEKDPDADAVEHEVSLSSPSASASGDWSLEVDEEESQLMAQTLPELVAAAGESFSMSEFAGLGPELGSSMAGSTSSVLQTRMASSSQQASPESSSSSSRTVLPASPPSQSWTRHPTPVQRRPSALRHEVVWDSDSSTNRETSGDHSSLGRSTGPDSSGLNLSGRSDRSGSTLNGSVRINASPLSSPVAALAQTARSTTPISPALSAGSSIRSPATVRRVRSSPPKQAAQSSPTPTSLFAPSAIQPGPVDASSSAPSRSIFADMSAEQAQLSWPLAPGSMPVPLSSGPGSRQVLAQQDEDAEDEASVRSVVFSDMHMPGALSDSPYRIARSGTRPLSALITPRDRSSGRRAAAATPSTVGERSRYYDARSTLTPGSTSPLSSPPAALRSSLSLSTSAPQPTLALRPAAEQLSTVAQQIVPPTQAVFAAHNAHVQALAEEMDIYRELVQRLQAEVAERDDWVARLNVRVVEGETWRVQAEALALDAEQQVLQAREQKRGSGAGSGSGSGRLSPPDYPRRTISPTPSLADSPTPSTGPRRLPQQAERSHSGEADRTTVVQGETRDLEIRLAKALNEVEGLSRQVRAIQEEKEGLVQDLKSGQQEARRAEERERDGVVGMQRELQAVQGLRAELEQARRDREGLERDVEREKARAEEGQTKQRVLEQTVRDERADVQSLRQELEMARESARGSGIGREDVWREMEQLREELQWEKAERARAERRVEDELEVRAGLEAEVDELRQAIRLLQLAPAPSTTSSQVAAEARAAELESRLRALRAESASKDLEIAALQRRKQELKEDREMLNIALDSKQQELELLKRKFAVRGIAGSTPLGPSQRANVSPSTRELQTPGPLPKSTPAGGRASVGRRASSRLSVDSALVTPGLEQGARAMRSRDIQLHPSTQVKSRVMRKELAPRESTHRVQRAEMEVLGEENVPPAEEEMGLGMGRRGSLRGARVLA